MSYICPVMPRVVCKRSRSIADLASFRTRSHALRLSPSATDGRVSATIGPEWVTIVHPPGLAASDARLQRFALLLVGRIYRMEAEAFLPLRMAALAAANGLSYVRVALRDMTSRWGSCSSDGRICLNTRLMALPDRLVDMVALHELAHTVHMNHGPAFRATLDGMLGGRLAELEAELKTYRFYV